MLGGGVRGSGICSGSSTPNMTGRRFHRTMEMIPALPWQSKSPSVSTLSKQSTKKGDARGASEVRRGTSSIHFHCPAPRSSSHIGHRVQCVAIEAASLALVFVAGLLLLLLLLPPLAAVGRATRLRSSCAIACSVVGCGNNLLQRVRASSDVS